MPPASLFLPSLPSLSSPMTADPSAAWASWQSAGASGLAVTCSCSLAPKIVGMPAAARSCWCCACRIRRRCWVVLSWRARVRRQGAESKRECGMQWWVHPRWCGIAQEGGNHGKGGDAGWRKGHRPSRRLQSGGQCRYGSHLPHCCPTTPLCQAQ